MLKFLFCLVCFYCETNILFAKQAEKELFENICKNIKTQNDQFLIKKKLKGISVLVDPVSGTQNIRYPKNIDESALTSLKQYSVTEQIEIINRTSTPIFPLKDTLFIIDAMNFFSEGIHFSYDKYFFQVVRKIKPVSSGTRSLYIHAVGIREDDLILSMKFAESNYLCDYYIKLKDENLKVYKSSILEINSSFE